MLGSHSEIFTPIPLYAYPNYGFSIHFAHSTQINIGYGALKLGSNQHFPHVLSATIFWSEPEHTFACLLMFSYLIYISVGTSSIINIDKTNFCFCFKVTDILSHACYIFNAEVLQGYKIEHCMSSSPLILQLKRSQLWSLFHSMLPLLSFSHPASHRHNLVASAVYQQGYCI